MNITHQETMLHETMQLCMFLTSLFANVWFAYKWRQSQAKIGCLEMEVKCHAARPRPTGFACPPPIARRPTISKADWERRMDANPRTTR
jgi:hypothetical protein